MQNADSRAISVAVPLSSRLAPPPLSCVIESEQQWRLAPRPLSPSASSSHIVATRWRNFAEQPYEVAAETADDRFVIGIALRCVNRRLSVSGRVARDGAMMQGSILVLGPGDSARCVFKGPSEALHIHVPTALVAECTREGSGREVASLAPASAPTRDPMIERLGRALLAAEEVIGPFGQLYVDCIGTAIVARLSDWARQEALDRPKVSELPCWRLKRAIDYVEAHLGETVSLADVASAAGLTRMHFAAQFRAATGLRPHEYLLRRRIERAQEMLARTAVPVVDVALSVGFQTQSHFTSVFKSFVGQPPHAWRLAHGSAPVSVAFRNEPCRIERLAR